MEISLETLVRWFEDARNNSSDAMDLSNKCRDYYDGKQLSDEMSKELKKRGQPPVVFNRIQPKIDYLLGSERRSRTDPKAFPRTPNHDEAADAATDAIRYVMDNNNFDVISSDVFENELIEGTGGVSVEVDPDTFDIILKRIPWDRYFYDPHSRERNHSDASYDGIVMWMDFDEAKTRWGKKAEQLDTQMSHLQGLGTSYEDKPGKAMWFDTTRKRVMVVQISFKDKGVWHRAVFTYGVMLEDIEKAPYLNEFNKPENCFIMHSAKVDRDCNRYGAVKGLIDIQDEINKRRSKSLHILNTRQTYSKEGHLKDISRFKREANKPNGHMEFPPQGIFGQDFGIVPDAGLAASQFQMYQESIQQMDAVSANAALAGKTDSGMSGKAIRSLQAGGSIELAPLYDGHHQWKKRVARAVWSRIKQYWKAEKWVRVTDDEENLKWVGLNLPVTMAEKAVMDQSGLSATQVKSQFSDKIQQFVQQNPEMAQQVEVANNVAEMDVDIILEEVPDTINLQSEQFELLVNMYQANPQSANNPQGIPFEAIVEMSTLRNKKRLLNKDDPARAQQQQQAQQVQEAMMQMDMQGKQALIDKNSATARKTDQESVQKQIENALILANPEATRVSI